MLQELSIKNFAIIDDLNICFSDGLTVLSGETGAGKSIIINAVNLLLGNRATPKLIRTGADMAELEALFDISSESPVSKKLKIHGYNSDEGLLIRRLISKKDRHKIFINGCLATMQILNEITESLASISGQHAHQGLLKEEQHLLILDRYGSLMPLRSKVFSCFQEMVPLVEKLKKLIAIKDRQEEHLDFLRFQQNEIMTAAIKPGEDADIEQELAKLKHGETLYKVTGGCIQEVYNAPGAAFERLMTVKKELEKAGRIDEKIVPLSEKVAELVFQVEDINDQLRTYQSSISFDTNRIEDLESRIDTLRRLKRKYGGTLEAVLDRLSEIEQELSGVENIADEIAETEAGIKQQHKALSDLVKALSAKRKKAAKQLAKKVEDELSSLKMAKTRFEVSLQAVYAEKKTDSAFVVDGMVVNDSGIDHACFQIAPNVGEDLKPLSAIASGGELSRVVLSLMAILAETGSVSTMIFDEVDAGIGGDVAEMVGVKLSALSGYHQIICITHLPQIAKFADHHFRISKSVADGRTYTSIEPVDEKERIEEIARMLGGATITSTTLEHAREMLMSAR
ncbi:MAG: DNA repair protein RecN [Desulfobacterales bacterium]|nr:DNA repair protein RecN [Desulfobacterales bacterium]